MKRMDGLLAAAVAAALMLGGCGGTQMPDAAAPTSAVTTITTSTTAPAASGTFKGPVSGESYTLVGGEVTLYENLQLTATPLPSETVERVRETLVTSERDQFIYSGQDMRGRECLYFSADWQSTAGVPASNLAIDRSELTAEGVRQRADAFLKATGLMPQGEYRVDVDIPENIDMVCCEIAYTATYKDVPIPGVGITLDFCPRGIVRLNYHWARPQAEDVPLERTARLSPQEAVERFENTRDAHAFDCEPEKILIGGEFCTIYLLTWETENGKPRYDAPIIRPGYRFYGHSWVETGAVCVDAVDGTCA